MVDWMDYGKIQQLKRDGFNKSQASRRLHLDYKTILKYWDVSPDGYTRIKGAAGRRAKKADKYKTKIIEWLREYPDMTAAQIYDWIKEYSGLRDIGFSERSMRNYVNDIRETYGIKLPENNRQYEAVEDMEMGLQGQVDMGEKTVMTTGGRHKTIYCFVMVLSCSRHKFSIWSERPFATNMFVYAHIKAFEFFGGRPKEIVYDQDKILAVSENHGDIIYTQGFQNFIDQEGFRVRLCKGSDPESKGKVENVVGYIKNNFAAHRIFTDIDSFNRACMEWLDRTGNGTENAATKKIPAETFKKEKKHLVPVSHYSFDKAINESITYPIRKDNTVVYKGNRYRVPKGTFKKGRHVGIDITDDKITVIDPDTGKSIATHPLCTGTGMLIGSKTEHEMSSSMKELENAVKQLFDGSEEIDDFLLNIHREKARYYRDQLAEIKKLFGRYRTEIIRAGLMYCIDNQLYSAGELRSAVIYLTNTETKDSNYSRPKVSIPEKYRGTGPKVRSLDEYESAMNGGDING